VQRPLPAGHLAGRLVELELHDEGEEVAQIGNVRRNVVCRAGIEGTVRRIHKVETAIAPRFQEHFVNANALPNAVDRFPHLDGVAPLPDVSFNTGGGGEDGARRRRRRA